VVHPNAIKLIKYIENVEALEMEYAEAGTLHSFLQKRDMPIGNIFQGSLIDKIGI